MNSVSTPLRGRLVLIGLLAVVPALAANVYLQSIERERARERTLTENLRLARLAASAQAGVFNGARELLLTLAAVPSLRASDPRACTEFLSSVLHVHPGYHNISVANIDGSLFCAGIPLDPHRLVSAKEFPWFERVLQTRTTAMGEPLVSVTTGKLVIVVAHPLLDSSGAVVRVVAAAIGLEQLSRTAAEAEFPPGTTLTLFDRTGTILTRFPKPGPWIGKHMPDTAVLRRLVRGVRADLREGTGIDGVRRLYATVPVDASFNAGLYLGLGVEHDRAFAEGNRILRQYLWLLAVVLVAAMGAAMIGGQSFVLGPVKVLKGVADRLAAGDLSARAELAGGVAGVSDLADAVNAMAIALDQRQHERDRAQAHLHEAEERIRFALEVSGVGVWEVNLKTNVSHWSETCEVMHGLAAGTYPGTLDAFTQRIHADDRDDVRQAIQQAIAARTNVDLEYRVTLPDGSTRRISSTGHFFFDDDGIPARGAGVAIDVTERRLLEEQLRQSLKMEAVGQLAGGIAHDFNNLLTVITGNTELALGALPEGSLIAEDLEHTRAAADRAAQLTRQLLAFSRKQVLRAESVDVTEMVAHITPMLRRVISEDIAVECVTRGSRAITIADRAQLEQALINLALNARDAMSSGGTLGIVTENVRLDATTIARQQLELEPGDYAMLSVSDTGSGMERDVLEKAFEPFFTTKPIGKGTGLGLSSVYGTVKQFGGHMRIESLPGHGTTVTIFLPRVPADATEIGGDEPTSERATVDGATILVVEDEGALRHLAARILSTAGYIVLQAGSGEEALQCARQYPGEIHLVLSDVVMPGMSATELTTAIRAARPYAALLLMSGYPNDEILRRGLRSQDFVLMEKPFTADVLRARVHQMLAGSEATRERRVS